MSDVRPREPSAEEARATLLDGPGIVEESLVAEIEPAAFLAVARNPELAVPGDPGRQHGIEQVHSPVHRLEQVRRRPEAHQVTRSRTRGGGWEAIDQRRFPRRRGTVAGT